MKNSNHAVQISDAHSKNEKLKVLKLTTKLNPSNEVKDEGGLTERSNIYNAILTDYRDYIHSTLKAKKVYKILTYIIVSTILISITATTIVLFFMYSRLGMLEWLAVVIPVLVSFMTTFIILPQIITNYVFDKDEETHMSNVLKLLIDYDSHHLD